MKSKIVRAISIRAAAFLVTLTFALALSFGGYIYLHRQTVFAEAAFRGYLFRMKALYPLGVDVNAAGCSYRNCFNPMWGAAYGGYDDEIVFLLDRGADVNRRPNFQTTALMVAAYKGHESTVRLLFSRGADVNANIDGDTALTFARDKGHPRIVELLRQAGAKDTR
jgi:ankyrin repeat protein